MICKEGVKLSHLFTGRNSAAAKPKGGGFFKKKPGKWHLGQPIGGVALNAAQSLAGTQSIGFFGVGLPC